MRIGHIYDETADQSMNEYVACFNRMGADGTMRCSGDESVLSHISTERGTRDKTRFFLSRCVCTKSSRYTRATPLRFHSINTRRSGCCVPTQSRGSYRKTPKRPSLNRPQLHSSGIRLSHACVPSQKPVAEFFGISMSLFRKVHLVVARKLYPI